jgi:hypothetical protein
VNNEFEMMWKEAFMAQFKVLSRQLPTGTDENHKQKLNQDR